MNHEDFISRWQRSGGAEMANSQSFLKELCLLLGVPEPEPTQADESKNTYVFEKAVNLNNGDGTSSTGRVDLYRQKTFVLESKQGAERRARELDEALATVTQQKRHRKGTAQRGTAQWAQAMRSAYQQAKRYAEALPEWPPFLIVCDVGYCFDVYADFSCSGKNYELFPDPRSSRIPLQDLSKPEVQAFLKAVWLDPHSLDPSKKSAKVTRELADRLARLAKSLEASAAGKATQTADEVHQRAHQVAQFLMRCLFTMFAEDVELIPRGSFVGLLESLKETPADFVPMVESLWQNMDKGGFSPILRKKIAQFNGGLFADSSALPLNRDQLELLLEAAKANWAEVEPAIFGTLLERALDPTERHKLGAHFTPRAYVERLVIPTVMEPLRAEWDDVYATATALYNSDKVSEAQKCVRDFHEKLCHIRILDPACGSGNFLYVALELMKKLEGEVIKAMVDFGDRQQVLITIDPHQFLGIEVNPRAAAIAELVLWIGYLQWHIRARGKETIAEPIIRKFDNIENRDAVLAWDSIEPVFDANGNPVTRWDGKTTKRHPVTGEEVPDETARIQDLRYVKPIKSTWPDSDYIIGNPPFVGSARMRDALGNGYTEAIRTAFHELPDSCDFVMYWWWTAARLLGAQSVQQFGFITTNSIKQRFNQRVVASCLEDKQSPVSIRMAVPDHPWVDAADGADVRIAMTVCGFGGTDGIAYSSSHARPNDIQAYEKKRAGIVRSNLTVGPDLNSASVLRSNVLLSAEGVKPHGMGFVLTQEEAAALGYGADPTLSQIIRPYSNGRDIAAKNRDVLIIDLHGHTIEQVRLQYPSVYQHVLTRVKPERDQNNERSRRENWWLFGRKNTELRAALKGLIRYVVTVKTSKHRYFVFLEEGHVPDSKLIAIALADSYHFGILSSRIHLVWSLSTGAHLGVGNDPTYVKSICFDAFAFPRASDSGEDSVRRIAEQLDSHRKRQQALHADLTITGMYNVLEKLRSGEELTAKEKQIHEKGLVSVLKQIHDELDAAVFDAYGWPHDLTDEEILERLVALNHERAEEEKNGLIRWLRPEFQNPASGKQAVQAELEMEADDDDSDDESETPKTKGAKSKAKPKAKDKAPAKAAWPKKLREQITVVRQTLQDHKGPASSEAIAKRFKAVKANDVEELLDTLASIGQARQLPDGRYVV
jgi:SAM-dependent methyltransferase